LACLVNSSRDILDLDLSVLRNMGNVDVNLLGKDRRIIISDRLIPESQSALKSEINRMSRDAYDSGRTKELITICSAEDAQAVVSDDNTEVVVLLENEELSGYKGKELCLAFKRSGDDPILINGVIAAGRALLYRNMPRLLDILRELSGDDKFSELEAADMEKLLTDDRYNFTRRLIITLPALVRFDIQEIAILNRAILEAVRAA